MTSSSIVSVFFFLFNSKLPFENYKSLYMIWEGFFRQGCKHIWIHWRVICTILTCLSRSKSTKIYPYCIGCLQYTSHQLWQAIDFRWLYIIAREVTGFNPTPDVFSQFCENTKGGSLHFVIFYFVLFLLYICVAIR